MARTYPRNAATQVINWVFTTMTRFGVGASYRHLLTVRGRKTGQLRTTPGRCDGYRRPAMAGGWLRSGQLGSQRPRRREVTLSRGGHQARYAIAEPTPDEAVPVLRKYLTDIRVTRPYFDATPASTDSELKAELPRHPVLRLIPKP